jgi:hypothetical protein
MGCINVVEYNWKIVRNLLVALIIAYGLFIIIGEVLATERRIAVREVEYKYQKAAQMQEQQHKVKKVHR